TGFNLKKRPTMAMCNNTKISVQRKATD
ncbi:unnamed protein product, partial [Rotaria sp. Silwood2]